MEEKATLYIVSFSNLRIKTLVRLQNQGKGDATFQFDTLSTAFKHLTYTINRHRSKPSIYNTAVTNIFT